MAYAARGKVTGVMPEFHSKQDASVIDARLSCLPCDERAKVAAAYSMVYKEAFDAETVEHRKEGKAAFAANTRLREYIKKKSMIYGRN